MVLGVTGGSGAGKGTLCRIFEEYGAFVIDTDKIAHSLYEKNEQAKHEIMQEFGTLDRKKIADIVFENPERLKRLSEITHKYIIQEIDELIAKSKNSFIVVDAPALIESGFNRKCNYTVSVIADKQLRIQRIIKRDGVTEQQAQKRVDAQKSDDYYAHNTNYVVENNGDLQSLRRLGEDVLKFLKI